ncbi:hypothetical protein ACRALDRAFT_1065352 [Sodiomyces alcalophilus JCM 7366]|uniref:uncharacterized protein n=1 Tax=Sodiomyces alcalophilus JCM 7366 TaxID=591952 RepID=UPI0039B51834
MANPRRLAGSQAPFHIFKDECFEDSITPMMSHAPMPAVTRPPKRPLSSSNTNNVVLNPPSNLSSASRQSPTKSTTARKSSSPRTPLKPAQNKSNNKLGAVTMAPPPNKATNNTDSLQKKPFLSKFKTAAQKPMTGLAAPAPFGKENLQPQFFPAPPTLNFDNCYMPSLPQKGPGKRTLLEAASIKQTRPTKKTKTTEPVIPPQDWFPPAVDDGTKPNLSYAQLIGMAILRSPNRRLTLAQIYKWISENFSFYKTEDAGWQNSIRHNLSLHKAFLKVERPKDDPGKGNYWMVQEGMEQQFMGPKLTRRSTATSENVPVIATHLEPSRPKSAPVQEPTLPPPPPASTAAAASQVSLPQLPTSQATIPAEVSSDATIPISDPPEDAAAMRLLDPDGLSAHSPLPAPIHSSPPVPRHIGTRSHTPPPASRGPATSSINRSHKRRFASMDDSGYISSLESSAMRPNQRGSILTSEADRPRSKRSRRGPDGRAELEIARLRASSYDSPTKNRSYNCLPPPSSSPFRGPDGQMLPPLTPAMKLKAPQNPPPSASPNTNLQIHRDQVRAMLQSPLRKMTGITDEGTPWSPAFNLDTSVYDLNNTMAFGEFDSWQDMDESFFGAGTQTYESPCKKSTRCHRFVGAARLGDANGSANNNNNNSNNGNSLGITSTPALKLRTPSNITWETPSKVFSGLESPSKIFGADSPSKMPSPSKMTAALYDFPTENLFANMFDGPDLLPEDTEHLPLDICQGFEKIGSGSQTASKKNQKPPMGRSHTTRF